MDESPPSWLLIEWSTVPVIGGMPSRLNAGGVAVLGPRLFCSMSATLAMRPRAWGWTSRVRLRVLADASLAGLLSLPDAFLGLQRTYFRASPNIYDSLLAEVGER